MDRFDTVQALARVVETGSFTKAVETLYMSRTSITQLVQQLETRLRVRLLNRTTREFNLTANSAAYHERVVHLLVELDNAETSLSSATLTPCGHFRIDVPSPLARLLLIPALPEFHVRYPEIQIDLDVSDRLVDLIDENVDYVIRGGELRDWSLMTRQVGGPQLEVYAAPAYLQHAGVPNHPRELEDNHQRIVGFLWTRTGKALPYAMHGGEESLRVADRHILAVGDGNAYLTAGLAGLGILWLPHYMTRGPLARGELLLLSEDWSLEPAPLYLVFPPNRHVSGKLRVFIEWVAELIVRHASPLHPPLWNKDRGISWKTLE